MKRREFFKSLGVGAAAIAIPSAVVKGLAQQFTKPEESYPEDHEFRKGDMILFFPGSEPFYLKENRRSKMDLIPVIVTDIKGHMLTMGPCEDIQPLLFNRSVDFVRSNAIFLPDMIYNHVTSKK